MRRKKSDGNISSFDLLLDTMCNTFGGIVFIALLLSILAGSVTRMENEASGSKADKVMDVERELLLSRLEADLQSMEMARDKILKVLPTANSPPALSNNTLDTVAAAVEKQGRTIGEVDAELKALLHKAETLTGASDSMQVEMEAFKTEIRELTAEIAAVKSNKTRKTRMPQLHNADGLRPVFFAVSDGKFYSVNDVSKPYAPRSNREYCPADVVVEAGPGLEIVEFRAGAGQKITPGCHEEGRLREALQNLNRTREYASFQVSPNSFREFNIVKTAFVEQGFSYNWLVGERTMKIVITDEALQVQ